MRELILVFVLGISFFSLLNDHGRERTSWRSPATAQG